MQKYSTAIQRTALNKAILHIKAHHHISSHQSMIVHLDVGHVVVVYSGCHDSFRSHSFQMPVAPRESPDPVSSTLSFTFAFLVCGWRDDDIGEFDDDLYA